ncbi:MAG: EAL domain-containing protein [Lachnospiraceae bacterium]|nr:EAL domain-containing protein [Lachnospiraceae bacterium]
MGKYKYNEAELNLIENSSVPLAVYQFLNKRVITIALSAGLMQMFGFTDRESTYRLMDEDMYRDTHPDDAARIEAAAVKFATGGGEYDVLYRSKIIDKYHVIHAHGKHTYPEEGVRLAIIWYFDEGECEPDSDEAGSGFNVRLIDMIRDENNIYNSVTYDYLTGLPSISYFFQLAEEGRKKIVEEGEQAAMLFIDLNGMKYFNRKYGFGEGDKLIHAVSRLLVKYFTNENCSRFGGDHFVAYTKAEGIKELLNKLFLECREVNDGINLPLRVGIYMDEPTAVSAATACDRAKIACDGNRNTYDSHYCFFDDAMLEKEEKRQYVIDNIDKAIREGYIKVYHQPIVRAANGRVCSEEALARWDDPVKGFLIPSDFIPALEDARLIYKLDLYMAEKILEKMKAQAEKGLYVVPESVNLSRSDFDSCDIVEEIRKRVDDAGISRDKLTIEITESLVADDFDFMKQEIERFQELGFKVWMDDFGSGYSSPEILQSIRFDVIKLDMFFMKEFEKGDDKRIVLTELIRMMMSLGMETVVEGVETEEQAEFLKEVGCTMLQGYYYCKPIPMEEIFERNRKGIQIGFENPEESDYYSSIGKVNLYDLSSATSGDASLSSYFNTMPMVVLEADDESICMVRCNRSYHEFMDRYLPLFKEKGRVNFSEYVKGPGALFMKAIKQCAADGRSTAMDEMNRKGEVIHIFIRRVAENPVTHKISFAVVILGVVKRDSVSTAVTYTYIARALSSDYINLYLVDLNTDDFIEYSPNNAEGDLNVERHGKNFFEESRKDAMIYLYEPDREAFLESFTRENILKSIDENDTFTLTYRLLINDEPTYVNMKAVRVRSVGNRIIIGVNNVDVQMRHREELERMNEERVTYSRITALAGDYISFYTVDPETDQYSEYNASKDYDDLKLAKEGNSFFEVAKLQSERVIWHEDLDMFGKMFSKENIMQSIEKNGVFILNYRLMLKGEPTYVSLKAAKVFENGKMRIIVGVSNIDSQVKRDLEYSHNLSVARNMANIDELTGVKNKHAYVDMEERLNNMIEDNKTLEFALVVFDLNGLKQVNDTLGHQAGDKFIKDGCSRICEIFKHSPVFRIGGDEFAVFAEGGDYAKIDSLMEKLHGMNRDSMKSGDVVVAGGMSRYEPSDRSVNMVFERADKLMYENKRSYKMPVI